ncbi:HD domain-containing protein [Pseudomonas sp. LRF_L74]|uniref:HD domain-containing protein n=1 Tax=Pseudomonas sp. LRF_L74 TaxID=3369422 RepID=UPI003F6274F5
MRPAKYSEARIDDIHDPENVSLHQVFYKPNQFGAQQNMLPTVRRSPPNMHPLESSWAPAWAGIGALGDGLNHRQALLSAYNEGHRVYHSQQHLEECLEFFDEVQRHAEDAPALCLALWYHDAIYPIPGKDKKERSARLAAKHLLAAGVAPERVRRVEALILAIRHKSVPQDHDQCLMVDINLAILAAPDERFDEYEQQIRQEYRKVPGFLFRLRRKAILRSLLKRPRIYASELFYERLEDIARYNLRRAIA